jgi:GT2 family glycosyltransferase
VTKEDRRAQLRYARGLLLRGHFRELLDRSVAVARSELNRLLGRSEEAQYVKWLGELDRQDQLLWRPDGARPLVSVLVPSGIAGRVQFALRSLKRQTWTDWEALVDAPSVPDDPRLRVAPGPLGAQLAEARGELVAILFPGDSLLPRALEQAIQALHRSVEAPMVYTDEGLLDAGGTPLHPRFKPDWSPELLLALPYTGQLTLFRREAVLAAGGFTDGLAGMPALHDLTLRVTERAPPVHLPSLTYQRRLPSPASASHEWMDVADAALARRRIDADLEPGLAGPTSVAVRRRLARRPRVAVVIPFRNRPELLERCVGSIHARTTYDNFEVLAVDNRSDDRRTLELCRRYQQSGQARVLRWDQAFNFAAINNWAATQTDAEYLVLLNNDTEVIARDWIEALLEHALRPEVGIVGARLLYPDGRLQHAGVVLGLRGLAGHPFDGWPDGGVGALDADGTGGEVLAAREVSAVTAACAMVRRALFLELQGMDTERFAVNFNDVDLCLRLRAAGYAVMYTPHSLLYHHTSASRGVVSNLDEDTQLTRRWGPQLLADPYYNQNLSLREAYRPRFMERFL